VLTPPPAAAILSPGPLSAGIAAPVAVPAAVQPSGQAVSPLGTPEQIEAEKTAMRTERTLPVAVSKAVLRLAWRMTAAKQYSLVGGPDAANIAALPAAIDE